MASPLEQRTMTLSDLATIYGCCGLFDLCSDRDLMSLSMESQNRFLDWIGWERSDVCRIHKNFITTVRPEDCKAGYISDPCGDSEGVEWGSCDFRLDDFALIRRHGPVRDATKIELRYCDIQPRYRLDGTQITSDAEYDQRLALEVIVQDLKRMLITGNATVPGQFDGLQRLVSTGYTSSQGVRCTSMDSMVLNWNGNGMDGGAGVTWNGNAIGAGYDFIDVLLAILRRIKDRIDMAPQLSAQTMGVGDIVIVAPTHLLRCLLDAYTCWSVCPGQAFREANLNTYEARTFRNNLNGGMFGAGKIYLDNHEIPLVPYSWELINGPTLADMYVLTGKVGPIRLISGQYNDLRQAPRNYPEANYAYTDGGRLLTWLERQKTCVYREVEMQPRLLMWAPWAQARIQDIRCTTPGGILSPDPCETSFFPESSFVRPECTSF